MGFSAIGLCTIPHLLSCPKRRKHLFVLWATLPCQLLGLLVVVSAGSLPFEQKIYGACGITLEGTGACGTLRFLTAGPPSAIALFRLQFLRQCWVFQVGL